MKALVSLGVVLLALWVVAWLVLKVASAAVHLLVLGAALLIIAGVVRGVLATRRTPVT